jgi:predicted RNA methylase
MNNWIEFVKQYAEENELSYREAMSKAKIPYRDAMTSIKVGGSSKSNLIRHIIYKAHKFNPNKINNKSNYIKEGKYFDKHQEIFNDNENTNNITKLRSDLITKKLLEYTNKKTNPLDNIILTIDNFNSYLNSGRKNMFNSPEKKELLNILINAISGYDYYPTPSKYSDMIFNDVKEWYKNDLNNINVLDVACGLLSLSIPFLKNNKVYMNELNQQFIKILEPLDKNENITLTKGNFFELPEEYYLKKDIDVIIMNPPFSGYIDDRNDKKIYLYFIIKAIDILYNSKIHKYDNTPRFLYVICPKTHFGKGNIGDLVDFSIPKPYIIKAQKMFNIDYLEDTTHHITFMSDVNGFRTIRNGKPSELKATFGLYKFEIV